ncbi:bacteriohemerythrin [Vibrio sp. WJH972]
MNQHHVDIFPWNDSFSTGVEEIDQQHKQLIFLLNQLANYISQHDSDIKLAEVLHELIDYAEYHFDSEETYWLSILSNCDYAEQHRESHSQFTQHIKKLIKNEDQKPEEQWLEELLSYLTSWLVTHILESDRHLAFMTQAVKSGQSIDEATLWASAQMNEKAQETINVILTAYQTLSANTIRLMQEIKAGKKTLLQLAESEESLIQAMHYAKIGRWSVSYPNQVTTWSPKMYELLGLDPDTTPGIELLCNIMVDDSHHSLMDSLKNSFDCGQEHRIDYQIVRPSDNAVRWIECRGKMIYASDGTPEKMTGFIQDITERKENEEKISSLAYYDSLTSLPNRRLLFDRLNHALALSNRDTAYNAVIFIDIDNFKNINDSHGHEFGDAVLQQAAKRIQDCIRASDTLARIGGDEFVLILSDLDNNELEAAAEAEIVAHKVIQALSHPYQVNKHQFISSASGGISLFNNASISSSELMKQADIAMYQAKKSGKNTVFFYKPLMQETISERLTLEKKLHKAVRNKQFELYYQPQVDNSNNTTGVEALIRWNHPTDGIINPDDFIPLSEETGLIIPIGDWVLEQACLQLKQWEISQQTKHLTISVNVSYRQFRQPDFILKVAKLISKYEISLGMLKLELTETMLVDDLDLTKSHMHSLKALGIQFSLDDFGTGYSSLQYLKRLPVNELKIDRSFISELELDINDQSIVKTTILMANSLGIDVIAEGVENDQQKTFLGTHGCLSYQGFLYSKPMPVKEFESYLVQ